MNPTLLPDLRDEAFSRPPKRQKTSYPDTENDLRYDSYTIAWICALQIEMAAALAMLDEIHGELPRRPNDNNAYTLGSIKNHNIVIACLPQDQYGNNNAANVLTNLTRTFPSIRRGLMVGIGGGAPGKVDIRLGDIVVGTRVMQYDFGKVLAGGEVQRTAIPKIPEYSFRTAVTNLRAQHELSPSRVSAILQEKMKGYVEYNFPSAPDHLFKASHTHDPSMTNCRNCDRSELKEREPRTSREPVIHHGGIASSNRVMKDAMTRDKLARELDIICFEMESAGLMDILPCLPIRGICDYSDSHKTKEWQRYAAAVAAAYARELLETLPTADNVEVDSPYNASPRMLAICPAAEGGHEAMVRLPLDLGAYTEAADQDDSEIESICDSVFTEASSSSSQVSAGDRSWNLVWDFAQLLLKHEELKDLYPRAVSQVGIDKFERNFHRLLKKFGRDLRKEANSPQQQQAAIFVRHNAKRTAVELTRSLRQADEEPTVSKTAQVDQWVGRAIDRGPADVRDERDWDDLPASESSDSERDEQISGVTVQEMKDFMVSAGAFSVLRQEFRVWLKLETRKNENDSTDDPEKSPVESQEGGVITGPDETQADLDPGQVPKSLVSDVQSPNPDQEGHGDDYDNNETLENGEEAPSSAPEKPRRWPSLRLWLWNLYCPPPPGFQRISYTCGCGEFTYLDVRELSPGGVEKFRRELLESTTAVRSRTGSVAQQGGHPDWPTPLRPMHSNPESRLSSSRGPARRLPSPDSSQSLQRESASASRARAQTRDPQYLLMCVNTRDLVELVHIEVSRLTNDQYLFERIRQKYGEVRKEHEWKISDAIPLRVRMLLHSMSSWLPNLPQLPGCLTFLADMLPNAPSMNLHKVASGDFVKFQLLPIGLNFHPGWFRLRQFPPKVHVDNGLYLYKPVPMKDAEVAEIPLLHLLKRGPHTERFWIRRFPKKLKDELTWSPEDERSQDGESEDDDLSNTGWGIRINEKINQAVVLLWILGFLITVGVATIVYAVVASDPSAAWGLGAFVIAGIALVWPTLQYYSFKEKK